MESLPTISILKFNTDTLQYIRKQYNLEQPGIIEDAVNNLCNWLKKQDHLVKKNFERDYLERLIINCKGSIERAKTKLDKICTFRTTSPLYFQPFDREDNGIKKIIDAFLPRMTDDHNRVFIVRNHLQKFDFPLSNYFQTLFVKTEYVQTFDYNNGVIVILDYRGLNIVEFVKVLNIAELEQVAMIITEGYGIRIKGIHIVTSSKMVDVIVAIFKQALSQKIGQRIHVHKSLESIYNYVPKDIMPEDYGGKEKTLQELSDDILQEFTSYKFQSHLDEMKKACTIETLRRGDCNIEHLGIPGSFRKLAVD